MDNVNFSRLNLKAFLTAVVLYVALLFGVLYKLVNVETITKFSASSNAFIDIVMAENAPSEASEMSGGADAGVGASEASADAVAGETGEEAVNFDELFGGVNLDKLKKDAEAKGEVGQVKSVALNVSQNDIIAKNEFTGLNTQTDGSYDAFMGRVTQIVQRRWVRYKANGNERAKISILIDKNGKFEYRIVEKSYNNAFNAKVRDFLQQLKGVTFPKPQTATTINMFLIDRID